MQLKYDLVSLEKKRCSLTTIVKGKLTAPVSEFSQEIPTTCATI